MKHWQSAMGWGVLVCGAAMGQAGAPVARGPVTLRVVPAPYREIASLPRLVPGGEVTPAVADKVNAALKKLDVSAAAAALDCRKSYREQQHKTDFADWNRTIDVTMRGPRFLSMVATDSFFCGGMYPNDGIILPLVYDLTTGSPVNWLKYLPAGAKSDLGNSADGAKMGVVVWPVLAALARKDAEKDCQQAFDDSGEAVQFALWLDVRQGAIEAQPVSFPHAMAACADAVEIDIAAARRMGFAAELVDALEAGQRLQR